MDIFNIESQEEKIAAAEFVTKLQATTIKKLTEEVAKLKNKLQSNPENMSASEEILQLQQLSSYLLQLIKQENRPEKVTFSPTNIDDAFNTLFSAEADKQNLPYPNLIGFLAQFGINSSNYMQELEIDKPDAKAQGMQTNETPISYRFRVTFLDQNLNDPATLETLFSVPNSQKAQRMFMTKLHLLCFLLIGSIADSKSSPDNFIYAQQTIMQSLGLSSEIDKNSRLILNTYQEIEELFDYFTISMIQGDTTTLSSFDSNTGKTPLAIFQTASERMNELDLPKKLFTALYRASLNINDQSDQTHLHQQETISRILTFMQNPLPDKSDELMQTIYQSILESSDH